MKKLIIFDLDGVLFDSKKNMEISWKNVMKTYKIKKKFTQYFKFVGLPFEAILKNLKISKNDISGISKFYNKISLKNQNKIKLYNNVRYTLNCLKKKNFKIGIVTSKNKIRSYKKRKVKDNSYLSYMKGIINGYRENKLLLFPLHKIIERDNKKE